MISCRLVIYFENYHSCCSAQELTDIGVLRKKPLNVC